MTIELLLHTVLIKPDRVEDTDEVIRRAKAAGIEVKLDKREEKAVEYGTVIQVGPTAFKDFLLMLLMLSCCVCQCVQNPVRLLSSW